MALQSPIPASAAPNAQRQPQTFEFTKRKKWADILVSELPDTVLLILDAVGLIQYVGPNTNGVLGWEVEDLAETDVLDIVSDDDRTNFGNHFQTSMSSQQDLSCYARLKCKPMGEEEGVGQKELLFEIRGHALYLPNDNECKCFFVVAKPYPSRNMAVLNTFLELKIENERLTQRLKDLKAQQDLMPASTTDHPVSISSSAMAHPQFSSFEFTRSPDGALQSPSDNTAGSFNAMHTGFVHSTVPSVNNRDEDDEDGARKKKLKKTHAPTQQYVCVTCGRTDSPEWRKGPRGPKTLCNACGLRWAKRSKRTDDVPIPYVQGQSSRERQDGTRTPSTSTNSIKGGRGAPVPNAALSVTPTEPPSAGSSSQRQPQTQQARYDSQAPTASPTHMSFSQASMVPPAPNAAHYGMRTVMPAPMHHQGMQSSPTSAVHQFSQANTQEQYQAMYDHYSWPMSQQREGGFGY